MGEADRSHEGLVERIVFKSVNNMARRCPGFAQLRRHVHELIQLAKRGHRPENEGI